MFIYSTDYFLTKWCKELPLTYSNIILTWLFDSTVSNILTIFGWSNFSSISISLLTPLRLCKSRILAFSYIFIATLEFVSICIATLTVAYAPYPILLPTLYYALNYSVLFVSSSGWLIRNFTRSHIFCYLKSNLKYSTLSLFSTLHIFDYSI